MFECVVSVVVTRCQTCSSCLNLLPEVQLFSAIVLINQFSHPERIKPYSLGEYDLYNASLVFLV